MVLALVPVMVAVAVWFKMRILAQYREVRKINSKLTGQYNENITGVRVVKALVREEQNLAEFGEQSSELYQASYRAAWLSALCSCRSCRSSARWRWARSCGMAAGRRASAA